MNKNYNELQSKVLELNPYQAGSNSLSRRRSILYQEMCYRLKPFSTLKQFQLEISKDGMSALHTIFSSLCPLVFDYDLKCVAKTLLAFLKEVQSIKREYDPKHNKPITKHDTPHKQNNSALVEEFLAKRNERKSL